MKILQVIPSLSAPLGGPVKAVLELSQALECGGHQVGICTTDAGQDSLHPLASTLQDKMEIIFHPASLGSFFYAPAMGPWLQKHVRDYDLLHIHWLWVYPTLVAARTARKNRIPYIMRPCGMLDFYCLSHHPLRKRLYGALFERENLNGASAVHYTSQGEQYYSSAYGLKAPARMVPLGVALDENGEENKAGDLTARYPELAAKTRILFLGRITFKKGVDLLIRAFAGLAAETPLLHLVLAGPCGERAYRRKLEALILRLKIKDRVTFTGFASGVEKQWLYQNSAVFCLPSYQENFGHAVMEAMAAGLPVVVSDRVNIAREIEAAHAGRIAQCDAEAIKRALRFLLGDAAGRERMGREGKAFAARHAWPKIIGLYTDFYREVLETQTGESRPLALKG